MEGMYKMGPCGFNGGDPQDMDMNGVTRIAMVRINSGDTINSVTILFERSGLQEWTPRWGGTDGNNSEIILGNDEYFTKVTGYVDPFDHMLVVRSLTFVSNRRVFGPYGIQVGMPFELPAAGGKIIGFHGRSGALLHALGTYVKMP